MDRRIGKHFVVESEFIAEKSSAILPPSNHEAPHFPRAYSWQDRAKPLRTTATSASAFNTMNAKKFQATCPRSNHFASKVRTCAAYLVFNDEAMFTLG